MTPVFLTKTEIDSDLIPLLVCSSIEVHVSVQKMLSQNFEVQVHVSYAASESRPESDYHFFLYRVEITNKGNDQAQLMSRHWIITDAFGQTEEVRGAGVVGLQPKISPGQKFEYESGCPLTTTFGTMRGTYQMVGSDGEPFEIEIPEFYLIAPTALH